MAPKKKTARAQHKAAATATIRPDTKLAALFELLQRKQGATITEMCDATGWQPHSVRGAMSGALKKKLGIAIDSAVEEERGRVYRAGRS